MQRKCIDLPILRWRKLHAMDVVGAQLGVEGNEQQANSNSNWLVVDCRNYVVHIQDEATRNDVNLQALWTGEYPLFRLNRGDENAVEDYVAAHPVPDTYTVHGGYSPRISSSSSSTTLEDCCQVEEGNLVNVLAQALEKRLGKGTKSEDRITPLSGPETSATAMVTDVLLKELLAMSVVSLSPTNTASSTAE
jgi:hypothetical protein